MEENEIKDGHIFLLSRQVPGNPFYTPLSLHSAGTLRSESEMERKPEVPASTRDEALFH